MLNCLLKYISSKKELDAFNRDDKPKVIGYFDTKKSVAYDEFVDASLDFQPLVSFYAIFNRQLVKQLGMKEIGEIHFYEVSIFLTVVKL